MQSSPDALSIALDIGAAMLRCGADVHRVEDAICRIMLAYNGQEPEVFTITSLIVVTTVHGSGGRTESRHVASYSTDLGRLEALNELSRRICRQTPDPALVLDELARITAPPEKAERLRADFGYLLGAGAFCIFFGGSPADVAAAAFIALLLCLCDHFVRPRFPNHLVYTLLTAAAMGLLAAGLGRLIPALHADKIMIADVMLQIPGLLLINGLRDMLLGDTIAGLLRIIEALLTALAIAAGFAVALIALPIPLTTRTAPIALRIAAAALGTLGFSLVFRLRRKRLIPAVIAGVLTISVYFLCTQHLSSPLACFTIASVVAGAYAELAARVLRAPVTVFLVPGLIPPLPGSDLYYTMASLVSGSSADFVRYGVSTVCAATGLAVGVLFSSLLVLCFHRTLHREK